LEVGLKGLAENSFRQKISGRKKAKSQIAGFNITSVTLVFGEFFKLTSPEEAEN